MLVQILHLGLIPKFSVVLGCSWLFLDRLDKGVMAALALCNPNSGYNQEHLGFNRSLYKTYMVLPVLPLPYCHYRIVYVDQAQIHRS